ncbi:MAG: ABC transporter ATP-binding protein [Actinomycetaceae bacterium]|nr:ABC transporter ATP-binding protein [Actinomycetaceae bacterium]
MTDPKPPSAKPSGGAQVRVENLHFQYPTAPTAQLEGFNLEVAAGEVVALLGPSGCAKTTVLRLIAGLETPGSGRILIDGKVVAGEGGVVPAQGRAVGFVFQDYALFPHLSVAQNVGYGLFRCKREQRRQKVQQMLEMVQLEDFHDRYPWQLSGGQQQRVALARALAPGPGVLLLDEPFSNLDTDLRSAVREEVRTILARAQVSAILVTHDEDDAHALADRIVTMGGK